MKKTIRIISIIGAFACFAISTTDIDIHEEQDDLFEQNERQTAYQEIKYAIE